MPAVNFHVNRLTPIQAFLGAWLLWIILFLATPITPVILESRNAVVLLAISNLALLLGLSIGRWLPQRSLPTARTGLDYAVLARMLKILIALGVASFAFRFVDYFVVRGIPLTANVQDIRSDLELVGPNIVSALYGVTAPATLASGLLGMYALRIGMRGLLPKLAIIPFVGTPLFSFLYGGRGVLFLIVAVSLIALMLSAPRITLRFVAAAAASSLIAFVIMMFLFLERIDEMGTDVMYMARHSRFTELVPVSDSMLELIDSANESVGRAIFYLISVGQYYIHGVFEFLNLVREKGLSGDALLWGRHQFFIVNQVIAVFQGERVDLDDFNPTSGVYSTFWGPAFIDFGYVLTPIYGFLFGAFVDAVKRRVANGDVFAFPLYSLLLLQVALVPVHNGIVMVAALYYNIGLVGVWIIGTWSLRSRRSPAPTEPGSLACAPRRDRLMPAAVRHPASWRAPRFGTANADVAAEDQIMRRPSVNSAGPASAKDGLSMAVVEVSNPHTPPRAAPQPAPTGLRRALAAVAGSWRYAAVAALTAALLAAAALAALRLTTPATWTYRTTVQITFPEAPLGTYPNGVPFSINEIIEPSVLARVYDRWKLDQFGIDRDDFYAAFAVRPFGAAESEVAERFRQRLADRRLTFAERERIESQMKAQLDLASRSAAEVTLTLSQLLPIPRELGLAIVQSVPLVWSQQAIEQKGALRIQGFYNAPELLPVSAVERLPVPLGVIMMMEAGSRLRSRLADLSPVAGITTVTDPETKRSFRDLEALLRDLEIFHISQLFGSLVHYDFGESYVQVERLIERHLSDLSLRAAHEQRMADAVGETIKQYVDAAVGLKGRAGGERRGDAPTAGPSTIPQVSEGFIDRIIELSGRGREAEQTFISSMTQRQLGHIERVIAINTDRAKWSELLDAIKQRGQGKPAIDAQAREAFRSSLDHILTELNSIWGSLNRIQEDFAANRVGRTARLFVPFRSEASMEHPVTKAWLIGSVVALILAVAGLAWLIGAWRAFGRGGRSEA